MGRFIATGQRNTSNGTDEDCCVLDSDYDWQWNDVACSEPRNGFLCEQEP